jgi:hypothetical protein
MMRCVSHSTSAHPKLPIAQAADHCVKFLQTVWKWLR